MRYEFFGSVNSQLVLHIAQQLIERYGLSVDLRLGESCVALNAALADNSVGTDTGADKAALDGVAKTLVFYAAATDFSDSVMAKEYFQKIRTQLNSGAYEQAIISVDNPMGAALAGAAQIPVVRVTSVYGQNADWYGAVTRNQLSGVSIVSQGPNGGYFRAYATGFGQVLAGALQTAIVLLINAGIDITEVRDINTASGFFSAVADDVLMSAITDEGHLTQVLDEVCELVDDLTVCLPCSFGESDYLFGAMLAGACQRIVLLGAEPDSAVIAGAEASGAKCEIVLADSLQDVSQEAVPDLFSDAATVCLIPAVNGDVLGASNTFNEYIERAIGGGNL